MELIDPRTGLVVLATEECLALLRQAQHGVGRVAMVLDDRPRILPVNYVMADHRVLFCTDAGLMLDAAIHEAHVEFEIDHIDHVARAGWSVIVAGIARTVRDPHLVVTLEAFGLEPYPARRKHHWVVIEPESVTGRRVPENWHW